MSDPSRAPLNDVAASASHLLRLLDCGGSVYTFTLGTSPGGKPMVFDLSKREDLIAVTRFHLRHLVSAYASLSDELSVAETLCEDMGVIIAESLVRDAEGFNVLDPDKSYLFAADDDYVHDHAPYEDDFPRSPRGLFDND